MALRVLLLLVLIEFPADNGDMLLVNSGGNLSEALDKYIALCFCHLDLFEGSGIIEKAPSFVQLVARPREQLDTLPSS